MELILQHLMTYNAAYTTILMMVFILLIATITVIASKAMLAKIRYNQYQVASDILKTIFENPYDVDAMKMLEQTPAVILIPNEDSPILISHQDIFTCLSQYGAEEKADNSIHVINTNAHIRNCIDHMLSSMVTIHNAIKNKNVTLQQISSPMNFYASILNEKFYNSIHSYAEKSGMKNAIPAIELLASTLK